MKLPKLIWKKIFSWYEFELSMIYAYRYLLGREPEDINIVNNNRLEWQELRAIIKNSTEYKKDGLCEQCWVPKSHFYSPIPDIDVIKANEKQIFKETEAQDIGGVNINTEDQIGLLSEFREYYKTQPFSETANTQKIMQYNFTKGDVAYGYMDALVLYCMLRKFRPKRVIEVGSGHSSCVFLDVNRLFFNGAIDLTFIEPYPETLLENTTTDDNFKLMEHPVQDTDIKLFEALEKNDILFIDSSHVSKTGSDVNFLFFEVIPRLKSGVIIHLHDILWPFEYPKKWVYAGRAWNEAYLLRALLIGNDTLRIKFFNSYVCKKHSEKVQECMPLGLKNPGGSIWLEKV